jgi:hypothetical protein
MIPEREYNIFVLRPPVCVWYGPSQAFASVLGPLKDVMDRDVLLRTLPSLPLFTSLPVRCLQLRVPTTPHIPRVIDVEYVNQIIYRHPSITVTGHHVGGHHAPV